MGSRVLHLNWCSKEVEMQGRLYALMIWTTLFLIAIQSPFSQASPPDSNRSKHIGAIDKTVEEMIKDKNIAGAVVLLSLIHI